MPLPYPIPPPPVPRPGVPSGPYEVPVPRHPQHRPVPLVLGESAMYPGMLSWHPQHTASRKAGLVLPVVG